MKKILAALLFLVGSPFFGSTRAPAFPSPQLQRSQRPDIVLITIDTLRADALGFAGNRQVQTPVLDRLAASGRVFVNTHAHNVDTLPSHTNILTGLYPYQHGVRDNLGFKLGTSIPTLASVLQAAGYATGAFVGGFPLDSQFGLNRGFDVYDCRTSRGTEGEPFAFSERRGDEVVAAALDWWRQQKLKGRPRFLWVHLFDPHAPYDPPEPFKTRFAKNPYLGEVSAADSFLAPLLGRFQDGITKPQPFVVVTADHGESLGEHGELTHGLFTYEATLKVPLMIWGPGVAAGRDARPARHVDIFPTVLQAAGLALPAANRAKAYPGRSLLAPAAPTDAYFESISPTFNCGWAPLRGTLHQGKKFISLPLPEVYDLARDPRESRNLFPLQRAAARTVFLSLPRESAWPPHRQDVQSETAASLKSLGYLTGSGRVPTTFGVEDDPKKLIGLDQKMHRVIAASSSNRVDEAIRLAREVVAQRPSMPLGQWMLAETLLLAGRNQEALAAMEAARRRGAVTPELLRQLGLTLAQVGRMDEALALLRPLAADGTPQSLDALALALSQAGKQQEAVTFARRAVAVDPESARCRQQLGLIELRLGHWNEAREQLQRAVDLNPRLPLAWNNLGVALYQLKQPAGAFKAWQRAIDLQPDLWDTLWNLGTKAAELGWNQLALISLERFVANAPSDRYASQLRQAHFYIAQLRKGRNVTGTGG